MKYHPWRVLTKLDCDYLGGVYSVAAPREMSVCWKGAVNTTTWNHFCLGWASGLSNDEGCGTLGRPDEDLETMRIYTEDECLQLFGEFEDGGICRNAKGGLWNEVCAGLNVFDNLKHIANEPVDCGNQVLGSVDLERRIRVFSREECLNAYHGFYDKRDGSCTRRSDGSSWNERCFWHKSFCYARGWQSRAQSQTNLYLCMSTAQRAGAEVAGGIACSLPFWNMLCDDGNLDPRITMSTPKIAGIAPKCFSSSEFTVHSVRLFTQEECEQLPNAHFTLLPEVKSTTMGMKTAGFCVENSLVNEGYDAWMPVDKQDEIASRTVGIDYSRECDHYPGPVSPNKVPFYTLKGNLIVPTDL